MTTSQKEQFVKILFIVGAVIALLQSFITTAGIPNLTKEEILVVGGVLGILSSIATSWYQFWSKHIPNKVAITGLIVLLISTLGGVNDIFKIVRLNAQSAIWVTWSISLASFLLQVVSKIIYIPTDKSLNNGMDK